MLNLEEEIRSPPQASNLPLILRTILLTLLGIAALAGTGFGSYYYAKHQESNLKLDALQNDITEIKRELKGAFGFTADQDDLKSEIDDINQKLDKIALDVTSIESDVNSIESDVGSIRLKIGY